MWASVVVVVVRTPSGDEDDGVCVCVCVCASFFSFLSFPFNDVVLLVVVEVFVMCAMLTDLCLWLCPLMKCVCV